MTNENKKQKVSIIFLCTGNTCRSPMAEYLFKDYLKQKKRSGDFTVSSAGLEAGKGDVMTEQADEVLNVLGVPHKSDRKARMFTVQMSLDADMVIGMTAEHAMRAGGDNAISFVDLIGRQIYDPFGYPSPVYMDCATLMRTAFDKILGLADEKLEQKRNK